MKLYFRLVLYGMRTDYPASEYLLEPYDEDSCHVYPYLFCPVEKRVWDIYKTSSSVWKQYHKGKKL